jgi:hypothetical protein
LSSLTLVPSNAIPVFGRFYLIKNYGVTSLPGLDAFGPPLPGDPRPDLPVYSLGSGNYMIDNSSDPNVSVGSMAMGRGGMMMGADSGGFSPMLSFDTNALWLDISGITNGIVYADLNNATNQVYEILTKTDLSLSNWTIESEVWPTNPVDMPFTLYQNGRTNLFVWAMDWTGVTENSNTTPDWWFWKYFGIVGLLDSDLDSHRNPLSFDYNNQLDPNVIQFTLQFTNYSVKSTPAYGTIDLLAGNPSYVAILVNDTNHSDAAWLPYASSNIPVSLASGDGSYGVSVGLRGRPADAEQTWVSTELTLKTGAPLLTVTNPVASTISTPLIQLQGLVNVSLASLTYDLSNTAGTVTGLQGYWQPQFYDTNLGIFTTNSFSCYDIVLTNGLNTITLHATDVSGDSTTRIVSYTLDYSGDHSAPVVSMVWPTNGTMMAGNSFTAQAHVDDATAKLTATISGNNVSGLVERDGTVWFNNLALKSGTNSMTITATDAAGNVGTTNLEIIQSAVNLTVTPLTTNQLDQPTVTVTGTIGDPTETVSVNGVAATLSGNAWTASGVPVRPDGTAALNVQVGDPAGNPLAANVIYQPQPAQVVLASYTRAQHDSYTQHLFSSGTWYTGPTETDDETTYWTYDSGGIYYFDIDEHDIEDPPNIGYGYMPAGEYGFSAAWENATIAAPYDDYGFPLEVTGSISHLIGTHVMIDPAGQPAIGQTVLYLVEVQLTNEDTGLQVSGDELRNQGETLTDVTNSDGSVWSAMLVSAPAGVSPDVTPTSSAPRTTFVETNAPLNIQITANGNPLDPNDVASNADFIVGQAVTFALSTNLPPGVLATNFQWSFQGNYFNNQSNAVANMSFPACSTVPYIDSSLLTLSQTTNWWVSGGLNPPSNYIASLNCTLMFTNGNSSQPYLTQGKFKMYRPQATITTQTHSVIVSSARGSPELTFGLPFTNQQGIVFSATISLPPGFSGTTEWVQVVNNSQATRQRASDLKYERYHAAGLDTSFPYGNDPTNNPLQTTDTPGYQLLDGYLEYNALTSEFEMWFLFQPDGGERVPLRAVNWNWSGSATNTLDGWSIEAGTATNSGNPSDFDAQTYPRWTDNVTNQNIWIPSQ